MTHLRDRLERISINLQPEALEQLDAYLRLLGKWNRRVNLTAFDLDVPTDDAVDRLIVEPVAAAVHVLPTDRLVVDIGSGGGSPAIPLKIAVPWLRMVLVESKTRKGAFLREAIRELALLDMTVETGRAENLPERADLRECVDIVTLRAVRADRRLWQTFQALLRPHGRMFWFGERDSSIPLTMVKQATHTLHDSNATLTVIGRASTAIP